MPASAPRLAPIFRSTTQLRVLTILYVYGGTHSLTELARRAHLALPLVSREVQRLEQNGLAITQQRGPLKLVRANDDHPSAAPLRQLLDQTEGASHHLLELLVRPEWHHIDKAVIFGSWAERFRDVPGPAPNDLDILLVAADPLAIRDVTRFQRTLSAAISLPVDAFGIAYAEWEHPEAGTAVADIKAGHHVEIQATEVDKAEAM